MPSEEPKILEHCLYDFNKIKKILAKQGRKLDDFYREMVQNLQKLSEHKNTKPEILEDKLKDIFESEVGDIIQCTGSEGTAETVDTGLKYAGKYIIIEAPQVHYKTGNVSVYVQQLDNEGKPIEDTTRVASFINFIKPGS